jgi:hypothetical protein
MRQKYAVPVDIKCNSVQKFRSGWIFDFPDEAERRCVERYHTVVARVDNKHQSINEGQSDRPMNSVVACAAERQID